MFENILHQNSVVKLLTEDVSGKSLPPSLLFYGEAYTGKLTTALELARILTCEKDKAPWNCSCPSCEQHRLLQHPSTVLLGNRYFQEEIAACADVLVRSRKVFAQYMYVRAVRKLLKRFDPDFRESGPKLTKVYRDIQKTEEDLEALLPGRELPDQKTLDDILERIASQCRKISKFFGQEPIPIDQVRKVAFWAHTSGPGGTKIVIFENADTMMDSSRNALLKILEEPPPGCYLILTSKQKGSIIPTVLSRVRPYHFVPRNTEASRDVLEKIFRDSAEDYLSLKEYFMAWSNLDPVLLRNISDRWIKGLLDGTLKLEKEELISEIVNLSNEKGYASSFIEELLSMLRSRLFSSGQENLTDSRMVRTAEGWVKILQESYYRISTYNQKESLIIEQMLYRMAGGV